MTRNDDDDDDERYYFDDDQNISTFKQEKSHKLSIHNSIVL